MPDDPKNEVHFTLHFEEVPRHLIETMTSRFPLCEIWDPQEEARRTKSEDRRERFLRTYPDPNRVRINLPISDASNLPAILELHSTLLEAGVSFELRIGAILRREALFEALPDYVTAHIVALKAEIGLNISDFS